MRLAEFKMRLFTFFALKLLRWSGTIATEKAYGELPPAHPVDETGGILVADAAREDLKSGPPEHWKRLFPSAPPTHWLDLFRERSPDVLQEIANQSDASQVQSETSAPPTLDVHDAREAPQPEDARLLKLKPPILRSSVAAKETEELTGPSATNTKTTWLNRLRFSSPSPSVAEPGTSAHDPESRGSRLEDYPSPRSEAGNRDEASNAELPTLVAAPDPKQNQKPKTFWDATAETAPTSQEEVRERERRQKTLASAAAESERPRAEPETDDRGSHSSAAWAYPKEATAPQTVDLVSSPPATEPAIEWERTAVANGRVPSGKLSGHPQFTDSGDGRDDHWSTESQPLRNLNSTVYERGTPSRNFAKVSSDSPADHMKRATAANKGEEWANLNHPRWRPIVDNPTNSGAGEEGRRKQPRFSEDARELLTSEQDRWPTLPPAPSFEMADELLAKETEGEALRRLEQEQRGTLWNA